MTEKPDLEMLLNVLLTVTEGLGDTRLKKLAEDIQENPEYRRIKMLEQGVQSIFDKLYMQCNKPRKGYTVNEDHVSVDDDFEIIYVHSWWRGYRIKINYDGVLVLDTSIEPAAWEHLRQYMGYELAVDRFNKKEFIIELKEINKDNSMRGIHAHDVYIHFENEE